MRNLHFLLISALLIALVLGAGCTAAGQQDNSRLAENEQTVPTPWFVPAEAELDIPATGWAVLVASPGEYAVIVESSNDARELTGENDYVFQRVSHTRGRLGLTIAAVDAPTYAAIYRNGGRVAAGVSVKGGVTLSAYP